MVAAARRRVDVCSVPRFHSHCVVLPVPERQVGSPCPSPRRTLHLQILRPVPWHCSDGLLVIGARPRPATARSEQYQDGSLRRPGLAADFRRGSTSEMLAQLDARRDSVLQYRYLPSNDGLLLLLNNLVGSRRAAFSGVPRTRDGVTLAPFAITSKNEIFSFLCWPHLGFWKDQNMLCNNQSSSMLSDLNRSKLPDSIFIKIISQGLFAK